MQKGASQLNCIGLAKEIGFDAIELVEVIPHDGSSKTEYAKRLREECASTGMDISNYTSISDFK